MSIKRIIITENQYNKIKSLGKINLIENNNCYIDDEGIIWCKPPGFTKYYMICGHINDKPCKKCDENINESRNKNYGGLKWLKDHEIPLSEEEKTYFRKHKVTWGTDNNEIVVHKAKAKDDKDGEVYFAWTHRAWGVKPTKSEAVKMAKFIKSTS